MPAIEEANNDTLYYALYFIAVGYITILIVIFLCVTYCDPKISFYFSWFITILNKLIILLKWVLYGPFMESFVGVMKCTDNNHKILKSINCYEGIHIFLVILSIIFGILLLSIVLFCSLLHNETIPDNKSNIGKINDYTDIILIIWRFIIIIYCSFVFNVYFIINYRRLGIGY